MAKFKYTSKCAHPKKVRRIMEDFVNEASTISYKGNKIPILLEKGDEFATNGFRKPDQLIIIWYNFKQAHHKDFNANFRTTEAAKGFADITISLLHEIGHHETRHKVPKRYNRQKAIAKIEKAMPIVQNELYFNLPDEKLATEWARAWLEVEENRKLAKKFEKKFFKAWEK